MTTHERDESRDMVAELVNIGFVVEPSGKTTKRTVRLGQHPSIPGYVNVEEQVHQTRVWYYPTGHQNQPVCELTVRPFFKFN